MLLKSRYTFFSTSGVYIHVDARDPETAAKKINLVTSNGINAEDLKVQYKCVKCKDTGTIYQQVAPNARGIKQADCPCGQNGTRWESGRGVLKNRKVWDHL